MSLGASAMQERRNIAHYRIARVAAPPVSVALLSRNQVQDRLWRGHPTPGTRGRLGDMHVVGEIEPACIKRAQSRTARDAVLKRSGMWNAPA
jgi:hypothetical protein